MMKSDEESNEKVSDLHWDLLAEILWCKWRRKREKMQLEATQRMSRPDELDIPELNLHWKEMHQIRKYEFTKHWLTVKWKFKS